jgi:predicted amidohydrolase
MLQGVRKAVSSEGTETEIRVKRGVCMENLKVALLQILPTGSLEGNLQKGLEYCRKAKEMGADIALFPEMWSVGYQIAKNISELKASAIEENDPFLQSFAEAAKDLGMAVGVTFLEKFEPLPRNSFCLFDRFGTRKLLYAKVHTCDFGEECRLTPGDDFYVTET